MSWSKTYTKDPVNIDRLEQEIDDDALAVNLLGSVLRGDQLTIEFDVQPSAGDEATLDATVINHSAPASKPGCVSIVLKDGVDEPAAMVDGAQLYVDVTTGNLMVKFGNGHTVTLAVDE